MVYTRTTWINGSTPAINATHLNNIEVGIENLDSAVFLTSAVGDDVTDDYAAWQADLTSAPDGAVIRGRKDAIYRLSNTLVPPSGITIDFNGAGIRAGASRAGQLASQDDLINCQNKSDVTMKNGRFLQPASEYGGASERSVILLRDGARNVVTRCQFTDATGGDVAVRVRGANAVDCEVSYNTVTGYGIVYSQDGSDRTRCFYNVVDEAPSNGLTGSGNGTLDVTYNDDCRVIGNTVTNAGRMGIEDWRQTRRTIISQNFVYNPGQAGGISMGISAVGSDMLIEGNTVIDPGGFGIELGSSGSRCLGNLVEYTTAGVSGDDGIKVDDSGVNGEYGCIIKGNLIRGAYRAIHTFFTFGAVLINGNHIDDWAFRGIEHQGAGNVSLVGNIFRQSSPNNSGVTRMGINMGTGSPALAVVGNTVMFTPEADGGSHQDIMLQFSSAANQLVCGNTFDAGGVTSPLAPRVDSNGQTGADARIMFNAFLNGATLFVSSLVRPVTFQNTGLATITGTTYLGFYNATPVAKPTISGSRGGNAALADLLTDLAGLGLVTDSTSA